jgi:ornithine carbamoyltransferase
MPYQVNAALMAQAKDGAIFMHCMPHPPERGSDAGGFEDIRQRNL